MAKVTLNISIPDPGRFAETLAKAKKVGLAVQQSFKELGIASGSIEQEAVARVRRIEGIESVEEERTVSIPKPVGSRSR